MSIDEKFASQVLQAWNGSMDFSQLLEAAAALEAARRSPLAATLYRTWLSRNTSPFQHAAYFNLGAALANAGDDSAAEAAYRQAVTIAPGFLHPRMNLGILLERAGQIDKALAEWRWIDENAAPGEVESRSVLLMALNHLGRVLEGQKQYSEACRYLIKSLEVNPDQPDVLHHLVFLRQKQCLWPVYSELPGVSVDAMLKATSALAMLSISDDPQTQLEAARRYVDTKVLQGVGPLASARGYGHQKIRIGYCSSDFCLHPVSMLTAQMYELHNKEEFELYAYCWSPEDGSTTRQRVMKSMDHFHRINHLSDKDAAELIRSHEIDILVDLQGQTAGARADMLSYRPAPIQITYLGLPATTGLPSIDYVIADEFLIPRDAAQYYSEKPLYMPNVYQVSDRLRPEAAPPTRAACGLPEDRFVYCSFNNNYKYTPDVFKAWMNTLRQVPGSVLWLLADNTWSEANLRAQAREQGVDEQRLIFAPRVSPENYLARFRLADLFLDSFPFNAGTTANDALWMGCPVLTLSGRSFASRMAGALLTAADLPQLITWNLADYEKQAVTLGQDRAQALELRAHLGRVRESGRLFDTPQFTRDLEQRFKQLVAEL